MLKSPLKLQKRSKVMGLPVGRKSTDWTKVAMLGAGAASTLASGLGAARKALKSRSSDASDEAAESTAADNGDGNGGGNGGGDSGGNGNGGGRNLQKLRLIIRETIEVAVPKTVAYNQWTQFADLPSIVKGVQAVDQEEDDLVQWTAKIGPSRRTWKAEITEQVPDEKISWQSKEGPENRGVISFHELDNNLTLVAVEMEYFPSGPVEKFGNLFLLARRRVRKDLRLFKHYIELAGEETGAWRGEIPAEDDEDGDDTRAEDKQDDDSQDEDSEDVRAEDEDEDDEDEDVRAEDDGQGQDDEDEGIDIRDDEREEARS